MLHKIAWLQLITEKRRLLAALAGIGFAVMLQLMEFGFRDALFESSTVFQRHLVGDLIMISSVYNNEVAAGTVTRRRLYQALGTPGVEAVTPVLMAAANFKNPQTLAPTLIEVIGLDPDRIAMDLPEVIESANLIRMPDVAIFDSTSRPEFGPIVDLFRQHKKVTTEVSGRRIHIMGLFELGVSFAGNGHIIVSDSTFRKLFNRPDGLLEFGLIRLKPGTPIAAVQADLVRRLPDDVRILTHDQLKDVELAYWDANTPIGFIFSIGAMVGLLVGVVIVYQILYTDVSDHLGEYATLKAMGYADRFLYVVVLEEALILSFSGFPIGFGLAQILYVVARNATHLPLVMTVERATMVFAFTVLMCSLSGLVAIRKLRAADPAEVF